MTKQYIMNKLLFLWIIFSTVIVAAGILLYGIVGFNYAEGNVKTFEVTYNTVVSVNDKESTLQDVCENVFKQNALKTSDKQVKEVYSIDYGSTTGETVLSYTFSANADSNALKNAVTAVKEELAKDEIFTDVSVSFHELETNVTYDVVWRGAIALAVGAVVALIYVAFRFGIGNALVGLIFCIHDVAVSLALLAITRLSIAFYTPVIVAGISVLLSLILWLIASARMRENFKDPAYTALSAEEAVAQSQKTAYMPVLVTACVTVAVLAVLGAVATAGMRIFAISAIIPVFVAVYSSLVFAPAVFVPVKAAFDKRKNKNKRYVGKQKAEVTE